MKGFNTDAVEAFSAHGTRRDEAMAHSRIGAYFPFELVHAFLTEGLDMFPNNLIAVEKSNEHS
jgi:hypothetical protein